MGKTTAPGTPGFCADEEERAVEPGAKADWQADKLIATYKETPTWFSDRCKERGSSSGRAAKNLESFDRIAQQMGKADWIKFLDGIFWDEISQPDLTFERRRELLADKEACPCCQQFLGHNKPPAEADADDPASPARARQIRYRRQRSFDFDR